MLPLRPPLEDKCKQTLVLLASSCITLQVSTLSIDPTVGSFACRGSFQVGSAPNGLLIRNGDYVPIIEESLEFNCVLAAAAAKGDAQEVGWLLGHTPTGYSPHRQQGANLALFASIIGGQHAACQLLLEWCNPNKEPMELPMCTFMWSPDTTSSVKEAIVSFLGIAYEWRTISQKSK